LGAERLKQLRLASVDVAKLTTQGVSCLAFHPNSGSRPIIAAADKSGKVGEAVRGLVQQGGGVSGVISLCVYPSVSILLRLGLGCGRSWVGKWGCQQQLTMLQFPLSPNACPGDERCAHCISDVRTVLATFLHQIWVWLGLAASWYCCWVIAKALVSPFWCCWLVLCSHVPLPSSRLACGISTTAQLRTAAATAAGTMVC
jgi:hypothetical protein